MITLLLPATGILGGLITAIFSIINPIYRLWAKIFFGIIGFGFSAYCAYTIVAAVLLGQDEEFHFSFYFYVFPIIIVVSYIRDRNRKKKAAAGELPVAPQYPIQPAPVQGQATSAQNYAAPYTAPAVNAQPTVPPVMANPYAAPAAPVNPPAKTSGVFDFGDEDTDFSFTQGKD
jgi:hypothetical protein